MTIIVAVFALLLTAAADVPLPPGLPADWVEPYLAGNLLFSPVGCEFLICHSRLK